MSGPATLTATRVTDQWIQVVAATPFFVNVLSLQNSDFANAILFLYSFNVLAKILV